MNNTTSTKPPSSSEKPIENAKTTKGKPKLHLLPPGPLIEIAYAMEAGANEYGPHNWLEAGIDVEEYISAVERHLSSFRARQKRDTKSGALHLAHAAAGLLILMECMSHPYAKVTDNRPPFKDWREP